MVIDDDPDNFDVVEALLDSENYQLYYAPSGQQALARLNSFQPDVILFDLMMPELDGLETCRRIKANPQWRAVPIIMVTALTAKEDLAECLAAGADDFMSKPINSLELRTRVNSMLRIKQQYDNVQALLQSREEMVNMLVHDLRNPIASIFLSAEIIRLPNMSPEKLQRKVDQLVIAGQQLQCLVDSLLTLAKLESNKMVLNYTEVDICQVCCSTIADFEAIAAQKELTLVGELPQPGTIIKVDAVIFRRVLDNLLSNAIKFSPSKTQVTLRAEYMQTGGAKVQVADFGPGVTPNLREKIFEKFEIGTTIPEISQIGLGLAFCKMAIEAHHGKITVEDNYPKGSIFTVLLDGLN